MRIAVALVVVLVGCKTREATQKVEPEVLTMRAPVAGPSATVDAGPPPPSKEEVAKLYRERLELYWSMDPAGREKALYEACATGQCSGELRQAIADAGGSDAERLKLAALGRKLGAAFDERAEDKKYDVHRLKQ